ncbi:amino acid permease [Streptomyces sp. CSDS2]|uniref:amino acid permease n=1 Tax=Streptomyces sp. CSDS2 TaxID=3055051 RepID=UPI0025B003AA|nr:amino acid permease [Streptomyces sp. CSDS2]MDN3259383.1 amino acid permease [Streptomyces sp. CSDS2]
MRVKSVEQVLSSAEGGDGHGRLRRDQGWFDLVVTGVGMVLGTGIFVFTGQVARQMAGPSVAVSFVLAAVVCGCAALCYAELASALPVAGSAYTFTYATLGELAAWVIGWALMLELTLSACVVAVGWSGYLQSLLDSAGIHLPVAVSGGDGSFVNLPAVLLILLLVGVLIRGGSLSKGATQVLVAVKVAVVLFVIVVGAFFVKASNYSPFVPPSAPAETASGMHTPLLQSLLPGTPSAFGVTGIITAAAMVFVAYIGFDVVATSAEETRRPQRDLPIGLLGSLLIVTVLYVAVSLVLTGMQSYSRLSVDAPVAEAFKAVGHPMVGAVISVGVVVGLVTVCMVSIRGQSRVLLAMSRDRLLPPAFATVHPRYATPHRSLMALGVVMALLSGFVDIGVLADLVNIGTLFAFVLVSVGVIVLRRTRPDLPRPFRVPLVPLLPGISFAACLYLMVNLSLLTWLTFAIWLAAGLLLYVAYGRRRSVFARQPAAPVPSAPGVRTDTPVAAVGAAAARES